MFMQLGDLKAGEHKQLVVEVPRGCTLNEVLAQLEMEAECGCGAKLVRKNINTWICPRERWYHRLGFGRGHACLKVGL